jgi:hypothetical protein
MYFWNSNLTCTFGIVTSHVLLKMEILSLAATLLRPLVPCLSCPPVPYSVPGIVFTPNTGTGHILWNKLDDETSVRSCPKANFCSRGVKLWGSVSTVLHFIG